MTDEVVLGVVGLLTVFVVACICVHYEFYNIFRLTKVD